MKTIFSLSWSAVRLARELSVICFSAYCSGNISYLDIHISAILKQRWSLICIVGNTLVFHLRLLPDAEFRSSLPQQLCKIPVGTMYLTPSPDSAILNKAAGTLVSGADFIQAEENL